MFVLPWVLAVYQSSYWNGPYVVVFRNSRPPSVSLSACALRQAIYRLKTITSTIIRVIMSPVLSRKSPTKSRCMFRQTIQFASCIYSVGVSSCSLIQPRSINCPGRNRDLSSLGIMNIIMIILKTAGSHKRRSTNHDSRGKQVNSRMAEV